MQIKKQKNILLLILAIVAIAINANAENTNSPYTRFGYGRLVDPGFSVSQAMGGVSYGLRTKGVINPANPASYAAIDSTSFVFEFGLSALMSNFSTTSSSVSTLTANLDYVALQVPLGKFMGLSLGLIPYSFVGYDFTQSDSLYIPRANSDDIGFKSTQTFSGNGGINQLYLGIAGNLFNHLSIGVNGYYMFGNIVNTRSSTLTSSGADTGYGAYQTNTLHVRSFNFRAGIQYYETIGKDHKFTIGAIYEAKLPLGGDFNSYTLGVDTTHVKSSYNFELPATYGGGVTYTYQDRLTFGADFTLQEYSKVKYYGQTDTLSNRWKIALGGEYIKNPLSNQYFNRIRWRFGANYTNSYVKMDGGNTQDFAVTFGMGFPLPNIRSIINFNLEYGNIANRYLTVDKQFVEQYFKIGLNLSINEQWFFKRKIN